MKSLYNLQDYYNNYLYVITYVDFSTSTTTSSEHFESYTITVKCDFKNILTGEVYKFWDHIFEQLSESENKIQVRDLIIKNLLDEKYKDTK